MNKYRFLIIPVLMTALVTGAHAQPRASEKSSRLALFFSPGLSYRAISYDSQEEWIEKTRNQVERPKFAFAAGVSVTKRISHRFQGRIGVQFSNTGYRTKKESLQWTDSAETLPVFVRVIVSNHQIGLPVDLCASVGEHKRTELIVSVGLMPAALVNTSTSVRTYGTNSERQRSNKSVGKARFGVTARTGLECTTQITDRSHLILGALLQYSLTSGLPSETASERGYSAHFLVGVSRSF